MGEGGIEVAADGAALAEKVAAFLFADGADGLAVVKFIQLAVNRKGIAIVVIAGKEEGVVRRDHEGRGHGPASRMLYVIAAAHHKSDNPAVGVHKRFR